MKNLFAKIALRNLYLPQENRNFMQNKVLQISLKDVLIVGKHVDKKTRKNYMMQFALSAELKHRYLSNQNRTEKFYARHVLKLPNKKRTSEKEVLFFDNQMNIQFTGERSRRTSAA